MRANSRPGETYPSTLPCPGAPQPPDQPSELLLLRGLALGDPQAVLHRHVFYATVPAALCAGGSWNE